MLQLACPLSGLFFSHQDHVCDCIGCDLTQNSKYHKDFFEQMAAVAPFPLCILLVLSRNATLCLLHFVRYISSCHFPKGSQTLRGIQIVKGMPDRTRSQVHCPNMWIVVTTWGWFQPFRISGVVILCGNHFEAKTNPPPFVLFGPSDRRRAFRLTQPLRKMLDH